MIPNEEKKVGIILRSLSISIIKRNNIKTQTDFYFLNFLHSFATKNKLDSDKQVCKNKDFCGIVMPSKKNYILQFNQYMKSDKMPYIIYADLESLIEKIDRCANNLEKS